MPAVGFLNRKTGEYDVGVVRRLHNVSQCSGSSSKKCSQTAAGHIMNFLLKLHYTVKLNSALPMQSTKLLRDDRRR
jgi:hypothetical protein